MRLSEFNKEVSRLEGTVVIDGRKPSHMLAVIVPSPRKALDNEVKRYTKGCFKVDTWHALVRASGEVITK